MITIDITMVIQIVNILVLIVILNAVLYKPIRTVLAQREEKLAELGTEVKNFAKNTRSQQNEIDKKMNDARSGAKAVIDEARGAAQAAGAETLAGIRSKETAAKTEKMAEIEKQFNVAREELKGQVEGFATGMAGKILGRSL